jgi:hypothetical protein
VIEAGIKESKGSFARRHLPTRHAAGLEVYQALVRLAQNLLRWFRRQVLGSTLLAAAGVKELVHIAARSGALVAGRPGALVLQFTADSRWAGICLTLSPAVRYPLWFPCLDDASLTQARP